MTEPGRFADGTPVPELGPGETGFEALVARERDRILAKEEAARIVAAGLVRGEHEPLDLGPYLAGAIKQPEPSRGFRVAHGGPQLLYPGLEHAVVGEMESGKSWFCAVNVAAELRNWRRVVYLHFEEIDPTGLIAQLRVCGATDADIEEHLSFVAAEERSGIAELVRLRPSVVIIDGVNEAMSLYGHKVREEDGAAAFRRELVKPFTQCGAAVLSADHVTKDAETRGRYALGSIHKGNALNGAMFMLDNVSPFGRQQSGMSRVYVTKDRPGFLRMHGQPTKLSGKTWLGDMVIDMRPEAPPEQAGLTIYPARPAPDKPVQTPEDRARVAEEQLDEQVMAAVLRIIDEKQEANTNRIQAYVSATDSKVRQSLGRLTYGPKARLDVEPGPNRSKIYTRAGASGEATAGGEVVSGASAGPPIKGGAPDAHDPTHLGTSPTHPDALPTHPDAPE